MWPSTSRGLGLFRSRRPRIYLHIGAMKTGTTFLQDLLMANQENLARAGYLFPGTRWADQSAAARDVLGFARTDPVITAKIEGRWAPIAAEMLAHRGKASIYSMEFLSFADTAQATRIRDSLEDADVHVIITVRDAASTVPAQWQTSCRNAGRVPWGKFIKGVSHALSGEPSTGRAARMFQRTQGIPRMLAVWAPIVGADHVHVITVPPRGSDPMLLWQRFAAVVGVDPGVCTVMPAETNSSIGHPSAELLRLLNIRLADLPRSDYDRVVKGPLGRVILGSRSHLEHPVTLHRRGRVLAARWNRRVRRAIRRSEVDLVGELRDLPARLPGPDVDRSLRRPSTTELLDAAATGREGLEELIDHVRSDLDDLFPGRWVDPGRPMPRVDQPWAEATDPVAAAVDDLARLVHACLHLMHTLDALEEDAAENELEGGALSAERGSGERPTYATRLRVARASRLDA